ncbi:hypothetical protein [Thermicanus aegyptius]|uniref:hypothetical protein n=1 Tax=Thermicanus aegyptius TaxID=94009 RepID=UPI0004117FB2|nr:hypothetical protein [Thermicanus aegyptius]
MWRDLGKDLKICEAATPGPWSVAIDPELVLQDRNDAEVVWIAGCDFGKEQPKGKENARFIAEARVGWPQTIRYAMKLEEEIGRLREENAMLLEQLNQRGCRV